jgi:hypothetical protein
MSYNALKSIDLNKLRERLVCKINRLQRIMSFIEYIHIQFLGLR